MGDVSGRLAFASDPEDGAGCRETAPSRDRPRSAPAAFTINGRFFGQPLTGVQRYGREITLGLDRVLSLKGREADLAVPSGIEDLPALRSITPRRVGTAASHVWEQATLPWSRSPLLNLCNTGPALRRRQVVCIHDTNVFTEPGSYRTGFRLVYRALQPALARRAAAVATVSHASADAIARTFDIPVARIAVLPNGHEHALRWQAARATIGAALPLRPFVLLLGSRARHKNVGLLTGLAQALDERGLDLAVTGGAASVFAGEGIATACPSNIHWLGRVGDDDLALLFSRALCLAFPSLTEGFGLPIVEAMVHGCPVIASNRASMPEVCGDAALLAAPDDPAAWLAGIIALRDSPQLCDVLRERGRVQARRFSWAESARGYLELMDRIA